MPIGPLANRHAEEMDVLTYHAIRFGQISLRSLRQSETVARGPSVNSGKTSASMERNP
jgi:hypothetical protein